MFNGQDALPLCVFVLLNYIVGPWHGQGGSASACAELRAPHFAFLGRRLKRQRGAALIGLVAADAVSLPRLNGKHAKHSFDLVQERHCVNRMGVALANASEAGYETLN